jgi:hypothetical protein
MLMEGFPAAVFRPRNSCRRDKTLASLLSIHASLTISKNYGFNIPAGGTSFWYVHPLEPSIALSTSPFLRRPSDDGKS